ncbi:MAG: glycosyltransferase family 39 protein, partial [Planctomycetaceae bacterium]|nr:glycosyltransferase family 39 protein [Planctomycetaceae bacterium]
MNAAAPPPPPAAPPPTADPLSNSARHFVTPESGKAPFALGEPAIRGLVLAMLALHALLLGWGAYRHSPTYDEVAYLPAGISHWYFGTFELASVSPPLVRLVAAAPVVLAHPKTEWRNYDPSPSTRPAHLVGRDFVEINGERTFWLFTLARWACIPFSLIGGGVCFAWARALYGPASGLIACGLWCFSPNILAHGQLMTPDLGTTALGVAAAYMFWRWLGQPTWPRALAAGIVLGFGQLAKTTLVVFFVVWPVLWFAVRWLRGSRAAAG